MSEITDEGEEIVVQSDDDDGDPDKNADAANDTSTEDATDDSSSEAAEADTPEAHIEPSIAPPEADGGISNDDDNSKENAASTDDDDDPASYKGKDASHSEDTSDEVVQKVKRSIAESGNDEEAGDDKSNSKPSTGANKESGTAIK